MTSLSSRKSNKITGNNKVVLNTMKGSASSAVGGGGILLDACNVETLSGVNSDKVTLLRKSLRAGSPGTVERDGIIKTQNDGDDAGSDDDEPDMHNVSSTTHFWHDLKGDRANMFLLVFLYILQGIPLGLAGSVSFILGSRHATYKDQAQFSLVFWPFSLKLIWAPIIDCVYSRRFGRRKSWLVPTQYLIGIFMIVLSRYTDSLVERPSAAVTGMASPADSAMKPPPLLLLTCIFFMLNFLASVQDIAVDGWALTMLRRRNVGYASTANSVGQTAGYFIGNILFLALESPDFCNKFLRSALQPTGIVTLSSFLSACGIVFVVATTLVACFKHETGELHARKRSTTDKKSSIKEELQNVMSAYRCLVRIIKLPSVQLLAVVLLTAKVAFAASESVGALKLIEFGVQKEQLAFLGSLLVPLQIVLPILISKRTNGARPLDIYLKSYPYRIVIGLVFAVIIYYTPSFKQPDGSFPLHYYMLLFASYCVHQISVYCMYVASMAFSSRVSDPTVGGTYMTLLNTLSNLGGVWPSTLFLAMVDTFTWKRCRHLSDDTAVKTGEDSLVYTCNNKAEIAYCERSGGACETTIDGFYIEVVVGVVLAVLWLWKIRQLVLRVSALPEKAWKL